VLACAALLLIVLGFSAAGLLHARASGVVFWGTSLPLVLGFPAAIVVTAACGWVIGKRGEVMVARWTFLTAGSLLLYYAGIAAMTWLVLVQGQVGLVTGLVAVEGLGGYVLPFVLLQATLLASRDQVAGTPGRRRAWVVVIVTIAGLGLLLGAATMEPGPPLDTVRAPLADTWVEGLAVPVVTETLYVAWLLSVLVGPIALWRAVSQTSGLPRRRLALLAVVALLPILTIASCVALLPALMAADLSTSVAINVLFCFFLLTFSLTTGALAACFGPGSARWLAGRAFHWILRLVIGALFVLVAVTVSTLAALGLGEEYVPLVVPATVLIVLVLWPFNQRLARRLALRADPRLAAAAALVRTASGEAGQPALAVREVLRTVLADPDLQVGVRLPDTNRWVSVGGEDLPSPPAKPSDHLTLIPDEAGRARAYVQHTTSRADAQPIVSEVMPLIDKAVLELAVRHQAAQLIRERARADRAAEEERQRLERDLHDGVQGRLLALAIDLQSAAAVTEDGEAYLVLSDAVSSLRTAIEEVRQLGSGAAPEKLSREGLGPALVEFVRRMPIPVSLAVGDDRLDPATEVVAYLVVSEAVTNAVKHAGSCSVDVEVSHEHDRLSIRVADDGSGGADVRAGTGLRGLTERVGAAGGTLVISDRPTGGTLVEAALPCVR
jgi:signal transduction histidine kinase